MILTGGCHCGQVRFRITVDPGPWRALDCNCSMCAKKGFLHFIVRADQFELLTDPAALTEYRFHTGVARHLFCARCGIHSFYVPRSHPDGFDVNVRCLDGDVAEQFEVVPFDGRQWEQSITTL